LILPALFACAFAQVLIVANLKFAYDYVRQYSSHCALFARALFGKNLMFFSESVSDLMSDYDDVWVRGTVPIKIGTSNFNPID